MKKEIKCLRSDSKYFPKSLKKLEKCPKELFILGDEKILSEFSLSIIGSRNCSFLGKEISRQISEDLAKADITIVSGFARGIDTIAHKACINNKKKTIAVLGGGHGRLYPSENKYLIDEILECGGAIISEYPFEYPPLPKNFIERNRIIAALSDGVVLIEAQNGSGSLHTINYARKLNKKIFVVPGALNDEMYEGSNFVLAEGAFCIRNVEDVLKKYERFNEKNKKSQVRNVVDVDAEYEKLFNVLSFYPLSFEEICLKLKEPANKILYQLTMLEMEGFIKQIERQRFVRVK